MSRRILLDTDVVSYVLKQDTRAGLYLPRLMGNDLLISFMMLAELECWALAHRWGSGRRSHMDEYVRQITVIPSDDALCATWAEVTVGADRRGRPIACADAWIAATALLHDLPLVTHNHAHFAAVPGLRLLPPS